MIIYESLKHEFVDDVLNDRITQKIYSNYQKKVGRTSKSEISSWQNSMQYMYKVLGESVIPDNAGVAIEFKIPTSSKRIDFIISGTDEEEKESAVIIELKQWDTAQKTDKDAIVKTIFRGGLTETVHPSYQAWSYANMIENFNESVQKEEIKLFPCAYLHNYFLQENDDLIDQKYNYYIEKAPVFVLGDVRKLRDFISKYIKKGDNKKVLYKIENGKLRPSKALQDALSEMIAGKEVFTLIDEQKSIYESAKEMAIKSYKDGKKRVLIVKGGPGTGKSVLAINLLVNLTKEDLVSQYVTKNMAPRKVYAKMLKGNYKKIEIDNLFKSPGIYYDSQKSEIDALIVDEAHRLNLKSGMFKNKGENQTKEIIQTAKFSVFFIDENQKVHIDDSGSIDEILKISKSLDVEEIEIMEMFSQFRCNGSEGYLNWLDDVLEIEETGNYDGFDLDYDIQVIDNPQVLREMIEEKNEINNKARIVAGYCWDWEQKGRGDTNFYDINMEDYDFHMSWNLANTDTWAIDQKSVGEIGCIHTSQGLEFDYVGVIIGEDLRYEDGKIVTDHTKRAKTDKSLFGIKKLSKENPEEAEKLAEKIIKNTYRTLMTRGQKGCYIFAVDKKLSEYLKNRIKLMQENKVKYILDKDDISFGRVAEKE
ncbi:MAG: DUF2075 domain-containing protein [Clostridia bacterium]|nr:DUF2075 domain-containing protein [Clostridia bacterium]